MKRIFYLFLDPENMTQYATQHPRCFPHDDLHLSYLLFKHAIPQPINRKATRNINTPTGNTAAIKMPSPNAKAQIPRHLSPFPLMWFLPPVNGFYHILWASFSSGEWDRLRSFFRQDIRIFPNENSRIDHDQQLRDRHSKPQGNPHPSEPGEPWSKYRW